MDFRNATIVVLATLTVFVAGYFVGASKPQGLPQEQFMQKVMSGVEFQTQCFAIVTEASDKQVERLGAVMAKLDAIETLKLQNTELTRQLDLQAKRILRGCKRR